MISGHAISCKFQSVLPHPEPFSWIIFSPNLFSEAVDSFRLAVPSSLRLLNPRVPDADKLNVTEVYTDKEHDADDEESQKDRDKNSQYQFQVTGPYRPF